MNTTKQPSESFPIIALLTFSGGLMDAYSYICRGGVFANAQTGNILLMGVHLSIGEFSIALKYFIPIVAFILGIAITEIIKYSTQKFTYGRLHWRQYTLLAEAIILSSVAFFPQEWNLFANSFISFACGAQVESFRKVNGSITATTMCIGNLRTATQAMCDFIFKRKNEDLKKSILYFCIIGMFVIGAIVGNILVNYLKEKAILISALVLFLGFVLMLFYLPKSYNNSEEKDNQVK